MKKVCPVCFIEFNARRSKYVCCSQQCAKLYRGIKNRAERNTTCLQCGKEFQSYPNWIKRGGGKYCSKKCLSEHKSQKIERICEQCGFVFKVNPSAIIYNASRFCSHGCASVASIGVEKPSIQGEKHVFWKGGTSGERYPLSFNDERKDKIRTRDNHVCQMCDLVNEEHILLYGYSLQIHHIDYDKQNSDDTNLVSLCGQCHGRTNFNRAYWTDFFITKLTKSMEEI